MWQLHGDKPEVVNDPFWGLICAGVIHAATTDRIAAVVNGNIILCLVYELGAEFISKQLLPQMHAEKLDNVLDSLVLRSWFLKNSCGLILPEDNSRRH